MKTLLRYSFVALMAMVMGNAYAGDVTDVLTWEALGLNASNSSYADYTGIKITSDAVYAAQASSGTGKYIQLRTNNNNAGIVTTTSGGKLKSVTITFNESTTDRAIEIYGKNEAYVAATDLYGDAKGTLLKKIAANDDSKTLTVEGDYTFVGLKSASGAIYVDKIEITWASSGSTTITVQSPTFSVAGGLYVEPQTVALSCEEGAKILYTIPAGEDPVYTDDENYTGVFYDGTPLTISRTTTIKAMAVKDGKTSNIVTATYTIVNVENKGTADNPFTVADALTVVAALAEGATTSGTFFVKGTVVGTPDIQKKADGTFYGNANFDIADTADGTTKLTCYRLKGLENANIDNENYVRAKDVVVVKGQLQRFVKDGAETPEIKNGFIYSLDNSASVQDVKAAENGEGSAFNLAGQRVSANYKGVVIKNGKKNILK